MKTLIESESNINQILEILTKKNITRQTWKKITGIDGIYYKELLTRSNSIASVISKSDWTKYLNGSRNKPEIHLIYLNGNGEIKASDNVSRFIILPDNARISLRTTQGQRDVKSFQTGSKKVYVLAANSQSQFSIYNKSSKGVQLFFLF